MIKVSRYYFFYKVAHFKEIIVSDEEQVERLDGVIQWLDSLKPIFGEYSLGGYTSIEDIKNKYHLRLYKEGNHFISMHLVYYQTMLKASELEEIMKYTVKSGFIYEGINYGCTGLKNQRSGHPIGQMNFKIVNEVM